MAPARGRPTRWSVDAHAVVLWVLAGGMVLYLAIYAGGYDLVVRNQVGVLVWWVILLGALVGVLPAARLTRRAWVALGLLGGFVVWTALACTWSLSSERSLQELSRVVCYLGVFALALITCRDRRSAMRHVINAIAAAVVVVAVLALLSRLRPGTFAGARAASAFLPGTSGRLEWPLNYWNALAALMALGLPLLLSVTSSARTLLFRTLGAGALPLVALCGYLTFSRGGAIEGATACLVFIAVSPERIPKFGTLLVAAAGSAALIAAAVHRPALERGLIDASARHQGTGLVLLVVLVCVAVGVIQVGIELARRRNLIPQWPRIPRRTAVGLLVVTLAVVIGVAFALGAPAHVSHAWTNFKKPNAAIAGQTSIGRFGATSGEGRYAYWKAAIDASSGHVFTGSGPGTFQLLWLPRAPFESYVENAHSLYVETYAEVGLVGLALLVAFFVAAVLGTLKPLERADPVARTQTAGIAAALAAFLVGAVFDWIWQIPVLPVAVLFLVASALSPAGIALSPAEGVQPAANKYTVRFPMRLAGAAVAVACLVAIGVPLATTSELRRSQAAVKAGDTTAALADARSAIGLEPGAASPQLQAALVLELRGDITQAVASARKATADEPMNWQTWLVLSRLETESGHPQEAIAAFRRARDLNPRSSLFQT